jgi:biopolymer transport protein ExbD
MPGLRTKSLLRRDKPREEAEMDITPMIDCTFLLLIFFLVTSKMKPNVPIEMPKARHGGVVVEEQAVILSVVKEGEAVHVYKGNSVDAADLLEGATPIEQEEAVAAYVEQQAGKSNKRFVLIKAPKGIKQRDVARIEAAAGRADVDQLYVGVVEVK